jgi:hypothetical protein
MEFCSLYEPVLKHCREPAEYRQHTFIFGFKIRFSFVGDVRFSRRWILTFQFDETLRRVDWVCGYLCFGETFSLHLMKIKAVDSYEILDGVTNQKVVSF